MAWRVYIETTVISYLAARPSANAMVAAHQRITQAWWNHVRPRVDSYISAAVMAEIARGDPQAARARKQLASEIPLLRLNGEVESLADLYAAALDLPESAYADSVHLALAAYHAVDVLLTWRRGTVATSPADGSSAL